VAEWVIERLKREHQRADFSCGKESLDTFIRTLVTQYERRRLGRTFVATLEGETRVAGYYTLAAGSIDVSRLPESERKKYPKHPLPTVHIGRLAVDQSHRGKRVGETLLFHSLHTALEVSAKLGTFAVDVIALDEEAGRFYEKYGFIPDATDPLRLYVPMKTVEALFAP
jgi:GNAT superfamily N-acetyltransferase